MDTFKRSFWKEWLSNFGIKLICFGSHFGYDADYDHPDRKELQRGPWLESVGQWLRSAGGWIFDLGYNEPYNRERFARRGDIPWLQLDEWEREEWYSGLDDDTLSEDFSKSMEEIILNLWELRRHPGRIHTPDYPEQTLAKMEVSAKLLGGINDYLTLPFGLEYALRDRGKEANFVSWSTFEALNALLQMAYNEGGQAEISFKLYDGAAATLTLQAPHYDYRDYQSYPSLMDSEERATAHEWVQAAAAGFSHAVELLREMRPDICWEWVIEDHRRTYQSGLALPSTEPAPVAAKCPTCMGYGIVGNNTGCGGFSDCPDCQPSVKNSAGGQS